LNWFGAKNWESNVHIIITTVLALFFLTAPTAKANEADTFVARLKEHYQDTLSINVFSLKYHFLNKQYRDQNYWDFKTPNRIMSQRMVEVDLEKKHFYDNDILYNSGGQLYDRAKFQNDTESFFYEKSASRYGKAVINEGEGSFDRFITFMLMNIDFLAIRPLLNEVNIKENISVHHGFESPTTLVTHRVADDNVVKYEFFTDSLQLKSINKVSSKALYVYGDYQTTNGITFARSLNSYYGGAEEPAYIKYIDHFNIIEQVDPAKLKLPQGYGPELKAGDGVLVSEEIAKDIYLITDSSEVSNSLLQVNGDKITVYGGSSYPSLAKRVIKFVQEQFPNKTLSTVYVTHPHGHQIGGLKEFADLGVEILADDYTIAGIKAFPRFADGISKFKFNPIKHEQVVNGAHFYVLDNMHAKRQGFVHFKDSGLIFQAHFLHIPRDNTIAKVIPNYTRTFIDFVRSKKLRFHRIVGNYRNNNISVEVINKTYEAFM